MASTSVVVGVSEEVESHSNNHKLILYSYWRSSCSHRVRIALNFKGLKYDYKSVNLLKGEQSHPEFLQLNPVGFVPVLVDGPSVIFDSFAIIMNYIEEKVGPNEKLPWAQSVIKKGFTALEKLLKEYGGRFAIGDEMSMADIFLAPQLHSAYKKFNIDMNEFPALSRLHETYYEIPAFREALPENQPDGL